MLFRSLFTKQLNVSGVSTLGNTVIGGGTTELVVNGNARITGILTVGTASITFDGANNSITVGTGITIFGNTGIVSATEFRGSGANLTNLPSQAAFASGTVIPFHQSAAPTGWTKLTTHDNKALRVVSGTGGGSGGTSSFTSVFASRTPGGSVTMANAAVTLTTNQIPSHDHTVNRLATLSGVINTLANATNAGSEGTYTSNTTGGGQSHTHANTASFTGTAMDFAVQYIDIIIASKD